MRARSTAAGPLRMGRHSTTRSSGGAWHLGIWVSWVFVFRCGVGSPLPARRGVQSLPACLRPHGTWLRLWGLGWWRSASASEQSEVNPRTDARPGFCAACMLRRLRPVSQFGVGDAALKAAANGSRVVLHRRTVAASRGVADRPQ